MYTKYDKALVGVLGVVLTALSATYGSNHLLQVVVSLAVALGVYSVPNKA